MKKYNVLLLSLFFVFSCTSNKKNVNNNYEVEVVEAEGTAPIKDGNTMEAKSASLSDALKNALSLVVGVYVSGESLVSKSMLISDEITSKTEGYIEKYEVLKEKIDGDFYKTKIKAYVRKEDLARKLRSIENEVEKIGSPIIYIEIENNENDDIKRFVSDFLSSEFKKDSFRVISDKNNADFIVSAKISTKFNTSQGLGGFQSYSSFITGNIKTPEGEIVGGYNASSSGIGINEVDARNNSVLNSSRKVYPDIKQAIINFYYQKKTVKLEIENISSMNEVFEIIKYLRNIPLIKNATLKSYDLGVAVFDILLYKGNANDIASYLSRYEKLSISAVKDFSIKGRIKWK